MEKREKRKQRKQRNGELQGRPQARKKKTERKRRNTKLRRIFVGKVLMEELRLPPSRRNPPPPSAKLRRENVYGK